MPGPALRTARNRSTSRRRCNRLNPFYTAGGLNVELNRLRTEVSAKALISGDSDLLLDFAREAGGPVLELGCGDGRLLFPMARAGIPVMGIDLSPGMLAAANGFGADEPEDVAARMEFIEADMCDFDLNRTFAFAFCVFRSFNFIPTAEGQRAALGAVRRHLEPGARLLISVFDPDPVSLAPDLPRNVPRLAEVHWHPVRKTNITVEVISQELDPIAQVGREVWRFTEADSGGYVLRREEELLTMRWVFRWELRYMLELAGFEVEAEYSDYFGSPPAHGREIVILARAK